jgi:hypothetical protein
MFLLAVLVCVGIFLVAWMCWRHWSYWKLHKPIRQFYRRHLARATVILAIIVFVFALLGQIQVRLDAHAGLGPVDVLLTDTFRMPAQAAEPHWNWLLFVARIAAFLLAILLGFEIICRLTRESLTTMRLRLQRQHFVICGLGRIGRRLVQQLTEKSRPVVVIEPDAANPHIDWCRDRGALVLHDDAADPEVLTQARVDRAVRLFAVTGDDTSNLKIAVEACELLRQHRTASSPVVPSTGRRKRPHCYAHVQDADLAAVLRERVNRSRRDAVHLGIFNVFRNSARAVFQDHLIALRPRRPDEWAHYLILGAGPMGTTLALELAELSHFENLRRPRLTLVERNIRQKEAAFRARYPRFAPEPFDPDNPWRFSALGDDWNDRTLRPAAAYRSDTPEAVQARAVEFACNATFAEMPDDVADERFVRQIQHTFAAPNVRGAIFICLDRDADDFATAERLRLKLDQFGVATPIFTWLPEADVLGEVLERSAERKLIAFGSCEQTCSYDDIEQATTETLAQHFHLDFLEKYTQDRRPAWEELSEMFRDSNRSAAMHAHVKLAVLGHELVRSTTANAVPNAFTSEQRELLARMEHNRWLAERLLSGWRHGERNNEQRTRLEIVPWEVLPGKNKDLTQVDRLLRVCQHDPFRIVPIKQRVP